MKHPTWYPGECFERTFGKGMGVACYVLEGGRDACEGEVYYICFCYFTLFKFTFFLFTEKYKIQQIYDNFKKY